MINPIITAQTILEKIPAEVILQLKVALDADKTITRIDRSISPVTQAAIQEVFNVGGKIGLCTGRPYAPAARDVLKIFPPESIHVVSSGGALVTQSGQRISGQEMTGSLVLELISAATKNGCGYWFGIEDKLYINSAKKADFDKFLYPKKTYDAAEAPDLTNIPIAQMSVSELNLEMKAVLKTFEDRISYTLMPDFKGDEYVDINAFGVDKAAGMRQLAKYYGLPVEQIISVGDGLNDFEMVEASFGVAMGNAVPDLKKIAKLTIGHTDDDGLAEFLTALIEARKILQAK